MTVANENSVIQYTLTSGTQNLPTNFYFLEASHLTVTKTVSGVDTALVLNSDYTVNLPASVGGNGSIDMITGTIGDVVTIENCPPVTQETDYVENDRFPADVTEKGLDKLTMLISKVYTSLFGSGAVKSRFLQYPSTEISTNPITPSLSDRQASGNGTLAAFKGSDGAIDAISKGSVNVGLTLSNDSTLGGGSPDAVNGVTQAAVKAYADAIQSELDDTQAGVGGLDTDGNYVAKSGTNYIDGNADLNEDITDLDAQAKTNADSISAIDTRVTDIENDTDKLNAFAHYNSTAGQTIVAAGSRIDFGTQVKDDGANVTTGASWAYTVPETGIYSISASITKAVAGSSTLILAVTAGSSVFHNKQGIATSQSVTADVTFTTYLTASQTVHATGFATTEPLTTLGEENYITISRV